MLLGMLVAGCVAALVMLHGARHKVSLICVSYLVFSMIHAIRFWACRREVATSLSTRSGVETFAGLSRKRHQGLIELNNEEISVLTKPIELSCLYRGLSNGGSCTQQNDDITLKQVKA